jgi:AbrB family looped-hinge helix DNA binding protein
MKRSTAMSRWTSSVSPKGQITLPAEVRQRLGIRPKDRVVITMENGEVRVAPDVGGLSASFMAVPALSRSLTWQEMREIAHDEHAMRVMASLSSTDED